MRINSDSANCYVSANSKPNEERMENDVVVTTVTKQFNEEAAGITDKRQLTMLRQKYGLVAAQITPQERYLISYDDGDKQ